MPKVIPHVLAQHAEEAAFLWLLRDDAASWQPHYHLVDLAELDERVEAHIDGLRIAGDDGWEICQAELKWEEPGEIFAAAVLAIESGDRERIDQVVDIASGDVELQRGMISALGWTATDHIPPLLKELISSDEPARRRIGIGGYAVRREDPGASLARLLADDDPGVRGRACKAAGELGRADLLHQIRQSINHEDDACRFWANWSAVRLGDRAVGGVLQNLQDFAAQPGPFQETATKLAARVLPAKEAGSWLSQCAADPQQQRIAAVGFGAVGDPAFMPALFQLMHVDEVARVAGEAFSMITGVDLAYDDLEQDIPDDFQSGPTDEADDENVEMDPDENLPWPDPPLVAGRWKAILSEFQPGRRYLCGREISPDTLPATLLNGFQRQRVAAAMELAHLDPSKPLFGVHARGDWQRQLIPRWYPGVL